MTTQNYNTEIAKEYHTGSKLPDGHLFDKSRKPIPFRDKEFRYRLFKKYIDVESIELSILLDNTDTSALLAISENIESGDVLNLQKLAHTLHYSAGITKKMRGHLFRAASCTGALYHIELYVICSDLSGLNAGVYHYDVEHSRLNILRKGDFRNHLIQASANNQNVKNAPVSIIYTDITM